MKLSKRLEAIASFIDKEDKVLDVGCDHAYLDIYLALNRKNKMIIASDISPKVMNTATDNIKKYKLEKKIITYCTDGTDNIKEDYDTLVIAGMGYHTIMNIIKKTKTLNKIIICSNNHWDLTRKDINKLGYTLDTEKLIYESNKLYSIMVFKKGNVILSSKEIMVGKYNSENKDLYKIYLDQINLIYKKIPLSKISKKLKYFYISKNLKSYIKKGD